MPYRPKEPEAYRDKDWLQEQYHVQKRSTKHIADECDCSKETIRRWLDRHGIGTRSKSEAAKIRAKQHPHTTEAGAEALEKYGVNSWEYWDKEQREAFCKRLSDERTGVDNPMFGVTGEDHPKWNPDADYPTIYHTPQWKRTRKQVYERDDHVCQVCEDASSGPLHAHHQTPISKDGEPFDLDNLVTVCESCHMAIHYDGN